MASIAYIGNFRPEHSTENDVKRAAEHLSHTVLPMQEDDPHVFGNLTSAIHSGDVEFILWTRTWPATNELIDALNVAKTCAIPIVGLHLDRWWGLKRESEIQTEAFFRFVDVLYTADGGHEADWIGAGVNHHWLPPAVRHDLPAGRRRSHYAADIAFVGSWRSYHNEWPHRMEMVEHLQRKYRRQFAAFPAHPSKAIRGQDLADLYASTKVNVGDSCLAGDAHRYWSDRIPETLGRGGFLLHPWVDGLDDHFTDREHLATWMLGDWDDLNESIGFYLCHDETRERIAQAGREHVLAHHTYLNRVDRIVSDLRAWGMIGTYRNRQGITMIRDRQHGIVAVADLRPGTDDSIVFDEQWNEGVYRLKPDDVRGGIVVDLGANVGAVTVWALKAGAADVHAYEPDSANFDQLIVNCEANSVLPTSFREAVTAAGGEVRFMPGIDGATGGGQVDADGMFKVLAARFVDVIERAAEAGRGEVAVLKVDIEGGEYDIITPAHMEALQKCQQIVLEFHTTTTAKFGEMMAALCEWGVVETLGRPSTGGMVYGRRHEL